ncbi:DUF1561 family protein [Bartonella ancashensis]|uniref:PF07598 family protein n=1 Tax=Bartonella ancashensis TaxID=1318743 RepID=A0A0M3T2I6_9HYPH|nr:DUF1561 family protein [Bartonella ancashensis]ALE02911.1 hypothetical protein PU02_0097 [Bartonella ancashensis]
MKLRLLLSLLNLLVVHTAFSAPIPVPQKHPDTPHDKAIRVIVHTKSEYCYAPVFTGGEGYVYIDNCTSSNVKQARYDIFQRVSWKINDTWLCMTAPSSVTGIDGKPTADWDYLLLRPCVINDANQRWIIQDNAFFTANGQFRVKDIKWYAYISKDQSVYYDHRLTSQMKSWTTTIAPPGNISFKTFVGWPYINVYPPAFQFYYLQNNSSSTSASPLPLYYNPENGHIAQYNSAYGTFSCMRSKQSLSENWNWVEWKDCTDKVQSQKDSYSWDISQLDGREGFILDYQGNPLRVTQFGANWGVPYTMKPSYIEKDTTNSPKSNFTLSHDIEEWNRYVNGNLGKTLTYCPAPGKKKSTSQNSELQIEYSLPPDFDLTPAWTQRLWQIATSSSPTSEELIGFCGSCMLHSMQILAELQEYHQSSPLQSGGYFFDTARHVDPFISLRQRYPELAIRLETTDVYETTPYRPGEDAHTRTSRAAHVIASMLMTQNLWRPSTVARTHNEIRDVLQRLINTSPGTVGFVAVVVGNHDQTDLTGHVQPIIRTRQGLVLIPTNTPNYTLVSFRNNIISTRIPETLMSHLSERGALTIYSLTTFQMLPLNPPSVSLYVSQNNCTGEGENRRGAGQSPRSAAINQCSSGRCAIQ